MAPLLGHEVTASKGNLLELHCDNGVDERKLFCETADKSDLWFEDEEYSIWPPR